MSTDQHTDQDQTTVPHIQWIDEDRELEMQPTQPGKYVPPYTVRVQGAEAQRRLGEIRRRARAAMRSAGLTTDEIAVAMGVSPTSVERAERRDRERGTGDAQSTPPA
ncbi:MULTISPECIES: helix-turn-helix domain-containing protein [Actinomycetes]|uniref:helix-turn-helix domain-containing protein n=1 Tax=Actinomycetes TaxID=1760 RepID=UPI003D73BAE1